MDVVHGQRPKSKRDEAIAEFREGRVWCLVVTEVLARGMDFRGVKVVVNYGQFSPQVMRVKPGAMVCLADPFRRVYVHTVIPQADVFRFPSDCPELYPQDRKDRTCRSTWEGNYFLLH